MIRLNEDEWAQLTRRLGAQVVQDWLQLSPKQKKEAAAGLRERLTPVFARLEPDHSPQFFGGLEPLFKEAAIELLISFLKKTMIYSSMPDKEIVGHIAPTALHAMTVQLMFLASAAWNLLPASRELQAIADHLEEWDANADLVALLEEESGE